MVATACKNSAHRQSGYGGKAGSLVAGGIGSICHSSELCQCLDFYLPNTLTGESVMLADRLKGVRFIVLKSKP